MVHKQTLDRLYSSLSQDFHLFPYELGVRNHQHTRYDKVFSSELAVLKEAVSNYPSDNNIAFDSMGVLFKYLRLLRSDRDFAVSEMTTNVPSVDVGVVNG